MEALMLLFSWAPKSLQMVTTVRKLKDGDTWKESYDKPREHIKKLRRSSGLMGHLSADGPCVSAWEGSGAPLRRLRWIW